MCSVDWRTSSSRGSRSTSAPSSAPASEIEVRTRCSRIGTKSFELEHEIHGDGRLAAEAKSVLVGYDYERGQSVPLSAAVKDRLSGSRASA